MEINVTSMLSDSLELLSASCAELGRSAGAITWNNAKQHEILLDTSEKIDAFKVWVKDFGGWSDEEIAAWDTVETNALFVQFVAGDMREAEAYDTNADYLQAQEEGQASSYLYCADNGQVYFNLY